MLKSKKTSLTKLNISKIITKKTGLSLSYTNKVVDDLISNLKNLIKSHNININNFASFKIIKKQSRIGRNPKTKKNHIISSRKSLSFIVSKNLSAKIKDLRWRS